MFGALMGFIEPLLVMAMMDVKVRYQNSVLGFVWSFLKPILQLGIYYLVFGLIFSMSAEPDFPLKLFFGVLVWSWFAEGTSLGLHAFVNKKSIITKIRTNRLLPPISGLLTATINYLLNLIMFTIIYQLFVTKIPEQALWLRMPYFLGGFFALCVLIGVCNIILANLNVFFRDMQVLWELALTYGIFLTPIIYAVPIPEAYQPLYYAVDLVSLPFECMKFAVFGDVVQAHQRTDVWLAYGVSMTMLIGIAGYTHQRFSKNVADYL